jgi:hypothetical protein
MRNNFGETIQALAKHIMLGENDKAMEELTLLAPRRSSIRRPGLEPFGDCRRACSRSRPTSRAGRCAAAGRAVRRHRPRQEPDGAGMGRRGPRETTGRSCTWRRSRCRRRSCARPRSSGSTRAWRSTQRAIAAIRHRHQYQKLQHFDLSRVRRGHPRRKQHPQVVDGHYRCRLIEACAADPVPPGGDRDAGAERLHGARQSRRVPRDHVLHRHARDLLRPRRRRHSQVAAEGHAEERVLALDGVWAVMLRKPSDLGYSDDGYDLPPLNYHEHVVAVDMPPEGGCCSRCRRRRCRSGSRAARDGRERVAKAIELTPADRPFVWWCNLNARARRCRGDPRRGRDARVRSRRREGAQADRLQRRPDPGAGDQAVVAGFGMNWQHCADTGFVGLNDSFEQYYQAVRRFWRFGQTQARQLPHRLGRDRGRDRSPTSAARKPTPSAWRRDGAAHGRPVERGAVRGIEPRPAGLCADVPVDSRMDGGSMTDHLPSTRSSPTAMRSTRATAAS